MGLFPVFSRSTTDDVSLVRSAFHFGVRTRAGNDRARCCDINIAPRPIFLSGGVGFSKSPSYSDAVFCPMGRFPAATTFGFRCDGFGACVKF